MIRVAIVGGGISGLVTAFEIRRAYPSIEIVIMEASSQLGGKLMPRRLADVTIDAGAEAFLVRRPEMAALLARLGLSTQVVSPAAGIRPTLYVGGRLRELPAGTLMGIPSGPELVRDIVDDDTVRYIATEPERAFTWTVGQDISVGQLVADRFGEMVVRRSVDPLLGGVYSCRAEDVSLRASIPQLAAELDRGAPHLTAAVQRSLPTQAAIPAQGSVFGALTGGYDMFISAIVSAIGAQCVCDYPVYGLERCDSGWNVLGPRSRDVDDRETSNHGSLFDAVVIATPAPVASRILSGAAPAFAEALSAIRVAGSALVAMAISASVDLPPNSGVLVGTDEVMSAKAFTFSTNKWPHLKSDYHLVRASFGRLNDTAITDQPDEVLLATAVQDLSTVAGVRIDDADVSDWFVQRWPDGLPVYDPGYAPTVGRAATTLPAGVAVAGAYLAGVGVPACVGQAWQAASTVSAHLARLGEVGQAAQ